MGLVTTLEDIGLSKQEAEIYLSSLKLGIAKASSIAQKSGVKRGMVYYTLKLLKEKGFISEVIKSGVQYYSAVSPNRILGIINEERDKKKRLFEGIKGELLEIKEQSIEKPTIEVYEGYEGFKTIFSKLIEKSNQEFCCYLSPSILEYLPHFHEQFRKKRSKKRIKIKTITARTKELEGIRKLDKEELRETRFYDELVKDSETLYYILGDSTVSIKANKKEQLAIYIKDKKLAKLQRNIFEKNWKQAAL